MSQSSPCIHFLLRKCHPLNTLMLAFKSLKILLCSDVVIYIIRNISMTWWLNQWPELDLVNFFDWDLKLVVESCDEPLWFSIFMYYRSFMLEICFMWLEYYRILMCCYDLFCSGWKPLIAGRPRNSAYFWNGIGVKEQTTFLLSLNRVFVP